MNALPVVEPLAPNIPRKHGIWPQTAFVNADAIGDVLRDTLGDALGNIPGDVFLFSSSFEGKQRGDSAASLRSDTRSILQTLSGKCKEALQR